MMTLHGRRKDVGLLSAVVLLVGLSTTATPYSGDLPEYGINLDYMTYYMSQIPFMDAANLSNDWVRVNSSEKIWHNTDHPLDVDEDGYALWYPYLNGREGTYDIQLWKGTGAVTNQPFTVVHADGETTVTVDFSAHPDGEFFSMGSFRLVKDSYLKTVDSFAPEGNDRAVLDAVRFIPLDISDVRAVARAVPESRPAFSIRNGQLSVRGVESGVLWVYDGCGRAVSSVKISSENATITRKLPPGCYFAALIGTDGRRTATTRILSVRSSR